MTVLYQTTLDRKSAQFKLQLQEAQAKTEALKKKYPHLQLLVGHREIASKIHVVIAAASPPAKRRPAVAAKNWVEPVKR